MVDPVQIFEYKECIWTYMTVTKMRRQQSLRFKCDEYRLCIFIAIGDPAFG